MLNKFYIFFKKQKLFIMKKDTFNDDTLNEQRMHIPY